MQIWKDYDVRQDPNMKPIKSIEVSIRDCSQWDLDGQSYIPALYETIPAADAVYSWRVKISPKVEQHQVITRPAQEEKEWLRKNLPENQYRCSRNEVINEEELNSYIAENIWEFWLAEATARAIISQFYSYIKTEKDFCWIDMRSAQNYP